MMSVFSSMSKIILFATLLFFLSLPQPIYSFVFKRHFMSLVRRRSYNLDSRSSHAAPMDLHHSSSVDSTIHHRHDESIEPNIYLYNTLTGKKELFQPLNKYNVTMYTCGPTVYDDVHIGNFRAMMFYDLLKRVLMYFGYDVEHVCNLTDVDDKIIDRMFQEGKIHRQNITDQYIASFFKGIKVFSVHLFCCYKN